MTGIAWRRDDISGIKYTAQYTVQLQIHGITSIIGNVMVVVLVTQCA